MRRPLCASNRLVRAFSGPVWFLTCENTILHTGILELDLKLKRSFYSSRLKCLTIRLFVLTGRLRRAQKRSFFLLKTVLKTVFLHSTRHANLASNLCQRIFTDLHCRSFCLKVPTCWSRRTRWAEGKLWVKPMFVAQCCRLNTQSASKCDWRPMLCMSRGLQITQMKNLKVFMVSRWQGETGVRFPPLHTHTVWLTFWQWESFGFVWYYRILSYNGLL